jgi:hypothetical protein
MPIFNGALEVGATYLDMAMSLSEPHPDEPHQQTGKKLGDDQFAIGDVWENRGQLALVGVGVEPGAADVFARYAADELFATIDEVGIRDGANIQIEGYLFAPTFSIWTTIEECLNPPVIWEKERGWFTTAPFSEPEMFDFPDGIGPVECVNVEHEEVLLVPRWIDCKRVTFKYGLGDEVIAVLQTLHKLGLDKTAPVRVRGGEVSPRDVVAACLPDPAKLGDVMTGKTCAGTWVTGTGKDGNPREVYLYHVVDTEETWAARRRAGGGLADRHQPRDRVGADREPHLVGRRRPGPRGVRAAAVPGPAERLRITVGNAGANALRLASDDHDLEPGDPIEVVIPREECDVVDHRGRRDQSVDHVWPVGESLGGRRDLPVLHGYPTIDRERPVELFHQRQSGDATRSDRGGPSGDRTSMEFGDAHHRYAVDAGQAQAFFGLGDQH